MDWILVYVIVSYVVMILICRNWTDSDGAIPMDEFGDYADYSQQGFDEAEEERFKENKVMIVILAPLTLAMAIVVLPCVGVFFAVRWLLSIKD